MSGGSLIITLIYIYLLRCITKPLLYVSLFLIFVAGILCGYWAFTKVEEYKGTEHAQYALAGAITIWVITALYLCFICC